MPKLSPALLAAAPQLPGLLEQLRAQAQALHAPPEAQAAALERGDTFTLLEWLIPQRGSLPAQPVRELIATAEAILRLRTLLHPALQERGELVPVVFGTGGHRGEIAWGLTFAHVQAILQALLELIAGLSPAERLRHFGGETVQAVQQRGFLIGHDNRLLNPEFSFYAAGLLTRAGYRVGYGGRTATPELSLVVPRQGWAGSINFTPSHNPFRYGGIKLSPADGGLAGEDLTDVIEQRANALLGAQVPGQWPKVAELEQQVRQEAQRVPRVDVHGPYLAGLEDNPVARLGELVTTLQALPPQRALRWVVDPTWGAAVPVYGLLQQRLGKDILTLIHTEDDPYFGGQTTEPNEHTLEDALALLRSQHAPLGGAIRNDPDSDRGLVGDTAGPMKMNRFAVLVMRYLLDLGWDGGLVTTLPTSHFGPDFARKRGKAVYITKT
ncbi:MAG TPA: hypothetical protein VL359_17440, partial [bacterium]|nr:hypothetical protein [bacterium]